MSDGERRPGPITPSINFEARDELERLLNDIRILAEQARRCAKRLGLRIEPGLEQIIFAASLLGRRTHGIGRGAMFIPRFENETDSAEEEPGRPA
jgi:hypothetical protein